MSKMDIASALDSIETWDDEKLVGQLFCVASGGHAAKDILGFGMPTGERDEAVLARLQEYVTRYHLGAIIYFPPGGDHEPVENIRVTTQKLQEVAEVPLLISTDQENGTVARVRVGATHLPGAMALGATRDLGLCEEVARTTAMQLRAVGIQQTLAPVADVNVVAANPGVNIRSAGSDPELVSKQLVCVVKTLQDSGVAATLKHFPGYGSAAVDPHLGLPSVGLTREEWDATERLPFEAAINAGAAAVMLGHATFPALDPDNAATFSAAIVRDLLRRDLGFNGVIVTDAMDMGGAERPEGPAEACVSALKAGVDQVLMPVDLPSAFEAVLAALHEGRLDRDELIASARRILELKLRLGLDHPDQPELEVMNTPESIDLAERVAAAAVAARASQPAPALDPGSRVLLVTPGPDPQKRGVHLGDVLESQLIEDHEVSQVLWGAAEMEGGPWRGIPDGDFDEAVVVLRDAWKDSLPVADVLGELDQAGLRVHVVVTRSPFEASAVSKKHSVLFTYGDNEFAVRAAGDVLMGKASAPGALPMPVSDLESNAQ